MNRTDKAIIFFLICMGVLALAYSIYTPVFEASDEIFHYPVIDYIKTHHDLPVQEAGVKTLWEQEGSQPPLYYILSAALISWIDTQDLFEIRKTNPHAKLGIPLDQDNKNMILHVGQDNVWKGTVLAVHLIRFWSVLLAIFSVWLTYQIAVTLWPEKKAVALLASIILAFNPMFLFISGSVNNDNLTILLSTWALLFIIRIATNGATLPRIFALSILITLATLTKISGLTLLPAAGTVFIWDAWRTRRWKLFLGAGFIIALIWLALAGWWYARNWVLYNELLGLKTHLDIAGSRVISLWELRYEWYGFWVAYWGLFGAVNILMGSVPYWFYMILCAIGALGIVWNIRNAFREKNFRSLLIIMAILLQISIVFSGVIQWTMQTYASQGRLLFPVISLISLMLAYGIVESLPTRFSKQLITFVGSTFAIFAFMTPFFYILPAYQPPLTVIEVPLDATPVGVNYGGLELVAIRTSSNTVPAGGRVPVTIFWRASTPISRDYSIYLNMFGRNYAEIGKIDTYPGGGSLPTSQMKVGYLYADTYQVELDTNIEAPAALRLLVGIAEWENGIFVSKTWLTPFGEPSANIIVDTGVVYPKDGCPPRPSGQYQEFRISDFGMLAVPPLPVSMKAGDNLTIDLYWESIGQTQTNWTVFLQMLDSNNNIVAQADSPPLNNDYPTNLWRLPCVVLDQRLLLLPDTLQQGTYRIIVGLYDASSPDYARAYVTTLDGTPYPNNAIDLGTITIEK